MGAPGLHLTQIGSDDLLLEPTRSLNIRDKNKLIEHIVARLLRTRATRLYYDLAEQYLIDPVYYDWLNKLARAALAINVRMVCIHMRPTAAFMLAQIDREPQVFETALGILGRQAGSGHIKQ